MKTGHLDLWTLQAMEPSRYRIVARGEFGARLGDMVAGWSVEASEGETVLEGNIRDQAELHGLLARLRSFGVELVSVNPLSDQEG